MIIGSKQTQTSSSSSSSATSIDEQTNEALKILDDVVNAESSVNTSSLDETCVKSPLAPRLKHETLVFEFKPPASSSSQSSNQYERVCQSNRDGFYMSAEEFFDPMSSTDMGERCGASSGNWHGRRFGDVKANPLRVNDDDDYEEERVIRRRSAFVIGEAGRPVISNRVDCLDRFRIKC